MGDNQRLSTIVFGDIKGYTALMQDDEANAMALLGIFKEQLEECVPTYGGKIVQYFGDACLLSFESTSQAVRCTLKLQPVFSKKQVPVRFGIHLGEVIFTEDNVFGDGVNVASRIESMGVAGGILVSKSVRDQIINKPEFSLKPMGSFDFKNVEEPLEVFALTNEGIVVPRREDLQGKFKPPKRRLIRREVLLAVAALLVAVSGIWFLRPDSPSLTEEQRNSYLAILPFENETNQAGLDGFGPMVSGWLTSELMETGEVKIVGADKLKEVVSEAGIAPPDIAALFAESGIGILIIGKYYIQDNQLFVQANIMDTQTGLIVHAPRPIIRPQTQKSDILEELSEEILGYWEVRDLSRFRQNPPRFEAYQEYQEGLEDFNQGHKTGDDKYFAMSEVHFLKAFELDTTFRTPLLKLHVAYHNMGRYGEKDSLFTVLGELKSQMTTWERKNYEFEWERNYGENLEAARIAEEMFEMDPSDEVSFSRAMGQYVRANYPSRALQLRNKWDSLYIGQAGDQLHFSDGRDVPLYMLKEFDSIYTMYQKDLQIVNDPWKNRMYAQVLIQTGRYGELPERILAAPERGPVGKPALLYRICNTLMLKGKDSLARIYGGQLKDFALANRDKTNYLQWLGTAEMFMGNHEAAARHLESYREIDDDSDIMADLIPCYARMGATGKIDNLIEHYWGPRINGFSAYLRALAETIRGNPDQALEYLATSIREGYGFDAWSYAYDYHFRPLFDDPRFQQLVRPKG
ncbi:adenylate/guanylate cyclase domain-containing protein [Robiginitalea sp. SC105]|uniref:adenylate/guanylate cyclase domain-containing protein n=1 Tax=Robiginitalea sp. SC105 TaxID=2762332 RepID=UPI001639DB3C|nr:adenylate/guanylate cyclase domain-containing protein [Robiginitalea sp. SC105]MBC2838617.1 adenylate/guanylate cyclase domain-containing protein [Robiginitalea sp. SC105]